MLKKLSQAHGAIARFGLNTFVAFVLLNLVLWPFEGLVETNPVFALYGRETVYGAYPGREHAEVDALLAEIWGRKPRYDVARQFAEAPFEGRWVNVDQAGFRRSNDAAPWPPDPSAINVFLFGGSTLFGYGVADGETIPAQLEPLLRQELGDPRVRCYNFGQGGYYSSQERELFSELVLAGQRPQLAIFFDGLNDFYFDEPMFSARLRRLFEDHPLRSLARSCRHLPALALLINWLERPSQAAETGRPPFDPRWNDPELLAGRIERYLGNLRQIAAIAQDAGVTPLFVVQPVPTYHYDLAQHPFAHWNFGRNSLSGFGYPLLARTLEERSDERTPLWLGDLQTDLHEPLYVDQVHYSPKMSGLIAQAIARAIAARHRLDPQPAAPAQSASDDPKAKNSSSE